jgi:hypothetical protein
MSVTHPRPSQPPNIIWPLKKGNWHPHRPSIKPFTPLNVIQESEPSSTIKRAWKWASREPRDLPVTETPPVPLFDLNDPNSFRVDTSRVDKVLAELDMEYPPFMLDNAEVLPLDADAILPTSSELPAQEVTTD